MRRLHLYVDPDDLDLGPSYEYVKLLRCPECGRRLHARAGSASIPTFHCGRCRHTWNWLEPTAQRILIKVPRLRRPKRARDDKPLTPWR